MMGETSSPQQGTRSRYIVSIGVCLFSVLLLIWPSPIDPQPYTFPAPLPKLVGPLAKNMVLQKANRLFEGQLKGPESFAVDKYGTLYTGTADGKIFSFKGSNLTLLSNSGIDHPQCGTYNYEPLCGRVKGLKVGPDGLLYFVDSYFGLRRMNLTTREIETVVPSEKGVDGIPLKFLNSLDISSKGVVYFTDSSSKWDRRNFRYEVMETHPQGRVLQYDIYSRETTTTLAGLYLANGIHLSRDESFLIVSEMSLARLRRFYLSGPLAGTSDVLLDNLPGYPDNIKVNSKGNLFVGLASVRFQGSSPIGSFLDIVAPYPAVKKFIAKVMPFAFYNLFLPKHALAVEITEQGAITSSLHDPGGLRIGAVSEVFEYKDSWYIGHFESPYVGKLDSF